VPAFSPIDWRKPNLRLAYLVEGRYAAHDAVTTLDRETVRWCGPASRVGSGISAMVTVLGMPHSERLGAWESRISGCVFDQTIGSLKQSIQAISDVTMRVAMGDEDVNPTRVIDSRKYLSDAAMYGRWKGQPAAVMVVDMDDVSHGQVIGEGTWDRDPTNIEATSFSMTISIGQVVPPNMDWPMAQVPETTNYWETYSYTGVAAGPFSPTGVASPDFGISDAHRGKWVGQIFGGDEAFFTTTDPYGNGARLWRELVTYGALSGQHFAWVSPRYDQFCYDIAYEDTAGDVVYVSDDASAIITVFNNNDPTRGPTGTCVKFSTALFSPWSRQNRAWGKVAGGPLGHFNRPAGYTDIAVGDPSTGNPVIGSALLTANDQAAPLAALGPVFIKSAAVWEVFQDIVVNFLGGELHPDAIQTLYDYYTITLLGTTKWALGACVPATLTEQPPSMREVLEDLMRAIPGDLILRQDNITPGKVRKWMAVPRPLGGEEPDRIVYVGDLYDSDPARSLVQMSDPDGNYSNETTLGGAQYWGAPDKDEDRIDIKLTDKIQMIDLVEQSSAGVNQVITENAGLKYWKFQSSSGVDSWAPDIEAAKSRPQCVLEAKHGHPSMEMELGDLIAYDITGVYAGVGQIRGLLLDLDTQVVTVTTYHAPPGTGRVTDGSDTERSKERAEANNDIPDHHGNTD